MNRVKFFGLTQAGRLKSPPRGIVLLIEVISQRRMASLNIFKAVKAESSFGPVASASLVDVMNKAKHFTRYLVAFFLDEVCVGFCFDTGRETKVTAPIWKSHLKGNSRLKLSTMTLSLESKVRR